MDGQGRILFVNDAASKIYGQHSARELVGMRLADLLPADAAGERLELVRRVISGGEPVVARELWSGRALRCTIRRVESSSGSDHPVALLVYCSESPECADAARAVEFAHVDFGALSRLTPSELKVMALIGEGLSNAEIATKLHRAVKTVESHRAALTEKTGSTSRVQIGIMARRAGLLRRVDLNDRGRVGAPTA